MPPLCLSQKHGAAYTAGMPSVGGRAVSYDHRGGSHLFFAGRGTSMVRSARSWIAVASFCNDILKRKEAAERDLEEDSSSHPVYRNAWGVCVRQLSL